MLFLGLGIQASFGMEIPPSGENSDDTVILSKDDLDILIRCSEVAKAQAEWSQRDNKPKTFPAEIQLLISSLRTNPVNASAEELFDLLDMCNYYAIQYKPLEKFLKSKMAEIVSYCKQNALEYTGEFLSKELKSSYCWLTKKLTNFTDFIIAASGKPEFTIVDKYNNVCWHMAMSHKGDKMVCLVGADVYLYKIEDHGFTKICTFDNVEQVGLSGDGLTVITYGGGARVTWYRWEDNEIGEQDFCKIQYKENNSRPTTNSPEILLTADGKKAFFKTYTRNPMELDLDAKTLTEYSSEQNKSYQGAITMSASGDCFCMVNDFSENNNHVCYVKCINGTDKDKQNSFQYFKTFIYNNNSYLACDATAKILLKVNEGQAYIASEKNQNGVCIELPDKKRICSANLSADGNWVILGSANGNVYVYDVLLGQIVATIASLKVQNSKIISSATNYDGSKIVVARANGDMEYYDLTKGPRAELEAMVGYDVLVPLAERYDKQRRKEDVSKISKEIQERLPDWVNRKFLKRGSTAAAAIPILQTTGFFSRFKTNLLGSVFGNNTYKVVGKAPPLQSTSFLSKVKTVLPYALCTGAVCVAGYFAFKKWLSQP